MDNMTLKQILIRRAQERDAEQDVYRHLKDKVNLL